MFAFADMKSLAYFCTSVYNERWGASPAKRWLMQDALILKRIKNPEQ